MTKAIEDARAEQLRQLNLWKEQNHNPFVWLSILGEEVGEANEAALSAYFGVKGNEGKTEGMVEKLREEMVQVAAVALSFVDCLDRGEWGWHRVTDIEGGV